jgi:hypothetical protein
VIDEVFFIGGGPAPFLRLPRVQERFDAVEPEFSHPVKVSCSYIAADFKSVTLNETLDAWNCGTDRPMNVTPVSVKLGGR